MGSDVKTRAKVDRAVEAYLMLLWTVFVFVSGECQRVNEVEADVTDFNILAGSSTLLTCPARGRSPQLGAVGTHTASTRSLLCNLGRGNLRNTPRAGTAASGLLILDNIRLMSLLQVC